VSHDHDEASIRVARPEEYGRLREIHAASGELFAEVGIGPFPDDEFDHLAVSSVILGTGDPPVGFASVGVVDGVAHLFQVSVDPSVGRRRLPTALVAIRK
jgi:hypothetical protein